MPKLQTLVNTLNHAASVVSQASATTSTQKEGQKDWVAGVRGTSTAVGQIITAVQDLARGDKADALVTIHKAEKTEAAAAKLGEKGDKLLGVSS